MLARVPFLALFLLAAVASAQDQGKKDAVKSTLAALQTALAGYEVDTGRYPTTAQGLQALVAEPSGVKGWKGPYVDGKLRPDPWGNPYVYRSPGEKNPTGFDLYSAGPDGKIGTEDDLGR